MADIGPSSDNGTELLSVQDLNVRFAHESGALHAVRGVSFSLHAGESIAIVGESGSGKSALAMAIMGLLPDSARVNGSITLRGQSLHSLNDRAMSQLRGKSVAMVFQDPLTAMTPVYTVGEQIVESILIHDNCSSAVAMQRAIELLDTVGIAEPHKRVNAYPHEFSGGMRQRAMIAMAIANNPEVIIADEPTTALDVTIQAQVLEVLQHACDNLNAALLLITHDLGVVARVADKALVMYAGKVVEKANVDTLFKRPAMPYTLGLLGSLPSALTSAANPLVAIKGHPPSPLALPKGCSFSPRCPLVTQQCHEKEPELIDTQAPGQQAACIHHDLISGDQSGHADVFSPLPAVSHESSEIQGAGSSTVKPLKRGVVLLNLQDVAQHYPLMKGAIIRRRTGTVYAVDGIDIKLHEGETLALVGESGCGKSTTALSILELSPPTRGTIRLFDIDVADLTGRQQRLSIRKKVQVVFQDPQSSLDPRLPVFDLIAEPLGVFKVPQEETHARVYELLTLVGLDASYAERYPQQLSGGQCQRVCIARALALEPRLLILDEPVSALDVSIRAGIINLLERLKNTLGLSYLFIAHDLALVRHFADRVSVMYLGTIVETGRVDEVYNHPRHPYTRCLLSALPIPDPEQERGRSRLTPKGELPSPANPPAGCRFHTRCPHKLNLSDAEQLRCTSEAPQLVDVADEVADRDAGATAAEFISGELTTGTSADSHQCACHFFHHKNFCK